MHHGDAYIFDLYEANAFLRWTTVSRVLKILRFKKLLAPTESVVNGVRALVD